MTPGPDRLPSAASGSTRRRWAASPALALAWDSVSHALDEQGYALTGQLLRPVECARLRKLYATEAPFRRHILMARHGYGRGEYKYFGYPLPEIVETLRTALYPQLAQIANRWQENLVSATRYPARHDDFLRRCHQAGQTKPTPLLLRYGTGDFNCLHQDLYGEHVFPLQVAILLSSPERDFTGGEFVLTEQRPRRQSRVSVVPLRQGEGVIFPVSARPVRGSRGFHRVTMRHGVSALRSGARFTLGIIFHDAQ